MGLTTLVENNYKDLEGGVCSMFNYAILEFYVEN
jgi:hypothetical protein